MLCKIKKEAVSSSLHFYQYVCSKDAIEEYDHKPMEAVLKKSLAATPLALQRLLLQLQKHFSTNVILAEILSCAYIKECVPHKHPSKKILPV